VKTYLGDKFESTLGIENPTIVSIQQVLNIDDCIGKKIVTNEDFITYSHVDGIPSKENTHEINIKGMILAIEDIVRGGGLYLYCKTADHQALCLTPKELEIFSEV